MKKYLIILTLLLLGSCFYFFSYYGKEEQVDDKPQTVAAKLGDIQLGISSTGRVVSNLDVQIKCKASGEIETIPYDVSDTVKKGDLLMRLNPQDEERNLRQAKVSLKAAQAQFKQAKQSLEMAKEQFVITSKQAKITEKSAEIKYQEAKAKYERQKVLLPQGLSSEEVYASAREIYLQSEVELNNARLQVEQLKIQKMELTLKEEDLNVASTKVEMEKIAVLNAEQRLEDTKVYSPITAVVSERNAQVGQIISSGISTVNEGTTVLTLSDLARIFVVASVDESDIGKIFVGQPVILTVDAYTGKNFKGNVVRVATKGVNVSNVVTFEVKIEVLGEDKNLLKPEMTANVEIISASREKVLLVPVEAVRRKKDKSFVMVSDGNAIQMTEVELGIRDDIHVEVIKGLNEGEQVVVEKREQTSQWKRGDQSSRDSRMRERMMRRGLR